MNKYRIVKSMAAKIIIAVTLSGCAAQVHDTYAKSSELCSKYATPGAPVAAHDMCVAKMQAFYANNPPADEGLSETGATMGILAILGAVMIGLIL